MNEKILKNKFLNFSFEWQFHESGLNNRIKVKREITRTMYTEHESGLNNGIKVKQEITRTIWTEQFFPNLLVIKNKNTTLGDTLNYEKYGQVANLLEQEVTRND